MTRGVNHPTVLLLARHGETDWNRADRWQGSTGPPLNELGRQQAEALALSLGAVDAIYSSDTNRVRETASIVASHFGLPVVEDERLREVNFGEWEGLTRGQIEERDGEALDRWDAGEGEAPPGSVSGPARPPRGRYRAARLGLLL